MPPNQLVSLNIHDSFTFGDVEICISPDLGKFTPGDLVELSVWDRKPTGINPEPAVLKRNSTTPNHSASTMCFSNASSVCSAVEAKSSAEDNVAEPPPPAPVADEDALFGSTILHEDGSSVSSAAQNHTESMSSSPLPTRTVVADLPPKPNTTSSKPPIHPPPRRRKPPRHVREMSDMTLDTDIAGLEQDDGRRLSVILLITEASLSSLKGGRTQISILRKVADLYKLSSYDTVSIQKVNDDGSAHADFLLVTFKDQFISRGEMHLFQKSLIGSWVYEGKRLDESSRGYQATAREIRHSSIRTNSGLVTEKTTITFRSRSSRIIWLVQMSAEMWDYCSPYERNQDENSCEIYFDKWIQFVYKLFEKWKELEATHSLTVVFFSRSFLNKASVLAKGPRDVYGRPYEDHYRLVLDNEKGPDWNSLVLQLKTALITYPEEVGWTEDNARQPSIASRGNVLEAINVTLNLMQFHYLDRDLHRTGNSLVIVSAGNGVFEVDKRLARISYQRMMDNGIGCDILSLALPALHIAPFFIYTHIEKSSDLDDSDGESQAPYEVPHWMHLSFVSYESEESVNVDRLIEAKGKKSEIQADSHGSMLNIGPHGFLLPREIIQVVRDNNSPGSPVTRKTYRKQVEHPLSPRMEHVDPKITTARQLIAGRDIRDILDACRPRDFGRLPSSLHALLRLKSNRSSKGAEILHDRFTEWGTMRFEAIKSDSASPADPRMTSETGSLGDCTSSSPNMMLFTPPTIGLMRNSTDLASSQSSSFTSQFSFPYQTRGFGGSSLSALLQRSLSLESMDDSMVSSDDEIETSKHLKSSETLVSQFRGLMHHHDKLAAMREYSAQADNPIAPEPPVSAAKREVGKLSSSESGSRLNQSSFSSQRSGGQSGGMAAALVQYRTPSGGLRFGPGDRDISRVSRVNSMGRIAVSSTRLQRFHEKSELGLSPSLLIPPAALIMESPTHDTNNALRQFSETRQTSTPEFSSRPQEEVSGENESLLLRLQSRSPTSIETTSRPKQTTPFSLYGRPSSLGLASASGISYASHQVSRTPPKDTSAFRHDGHTTRVGVGSRRKRVLNPFRQQDEDEVLKTKSFNRRRWSHVFPRGEMEFKRHAGPNWKSLTAPAILPLGVDYFPSLDDLSLNYSFSPYNVTLEFQHNNFGSHKELMDEMVRQRLAQDFQLVSPNSIDPVNFRRERHSTTAISAGNEAGMIRHFLSMGYRMHVLTYDPSMDLVEVIRYESKLVRKFDPTYEYAYCAYCHETKSYKKVRQSFTKYADQYNWNRVDRLICGAEDREMREGMRFRRLMFGIIPPKQADEREEQEYVAKFKRLLDYFERLRIKDADESELNIKIVTQKSSPPFDSHGRTMSVPNLGPDSMRRFYVQIRKGRLMEWMEIAVDSTFDTSWTYRIVFSWLVASSGKVDAQVQMLQRRCTNFKLELIPLPSITTGSNMFIQPFKAPSLIPLLVPEASIGLDKTLRANGYIHDGKQIVLMCRSTYPRLDAKTGIFNTELQHILECIDSKTKFRFARRGNQGRQFIHPSGTLFVRVLTDLNESSILVVFGNHIYMRGTGKEGRRLLKEHENAYKSLLEIIGGL